MVFSTNIQNVEIYGFSFWLALSAGIISFSTCTFGGINHLCIDELPQKMNLVDMARARVALLKKMQSKQLYGHDNLALYSPDMLQHPICIQLEPTETTTGGESVQPVIEVPSSGSNIFTQPNMDVPSVKGQMELHVNGLSQRLSQSLLSLTNIRDLQVVPIYLTPEGHITEDSLPTYLLSDQHGQCTPTRCSATLVSPCGHSDKPLDLGEPPDDRTRLDDEQTPTSNTHWIESQIPQGSTNLIKYQVEEGHTHLIKSQIPEGITHVIESQAPEDSTNMIESQAPKGSTNSIECQTPNSHTHWIESQISDGNTNLIDSQPLEDHSNLIESQTLEDNSNVIESQTPKVHSNLIERQTLEGHSNLIESQTPKVHTHSIESQTPKDIFHLIKSQTPEGSTHLNGKKPIKIVTDVW